LKSTLFIREKFKAESISSKENVPYSLNLIAKEKQNHQNYQEVVLPVQEIILIHQQLIVIYFPYKILME
jgi:hypothetical protein